MYFTCIIVGTVLAAVYVFHATRVKPLFLILFVLDVNHAGIVATVMNALAVIMYLGM
jgi:hypothetical protein